MFRTGYICPARQLHALGYLDAGAVGVPVPGHQALHQLRRRGLPRTVSVREQRPCALEVPGPVASAIRPVVVHRLLSLYGRGEDRVEDAVPGARVRLGVIGEGQGVTTSRRRGLKRTRPGTGSRVSTCCQYMLMSISRSV